MGSDGQAALNHAYDALLDLAEAIGVPPKALSLNGALAIAFGARGTGGKDAALAHYERDKKVINLTKIRGAGSLAHEWFHAADHYFGELAGKVDPKAEPSTAYLTYGPNWKNEARPELLAAFKHVVDAMTVKEKGVAIEEESAKRRLKSQADQMDYYLNDLRSHLADGRYNRGKKAATPAQLKEWDALSARLKSGDRGEDVHVPAKNGGRFSLGHTSSSVIRDMNAIYKAVTGRSFDRADEASTGRRLYWGTRSIADAEKRIAQAQEGGTETRRYGTEYLNEAKKIDGFRASDYWSTPHEMGARAFESFIFDKLAAGAKRSDYLVHAVENKYYAMLGMKPYPEGEERKAIDTAFDDLFAAVQTKPTDTGEAMFSPNAAPPFRSVLGEKIAAAPYAKNGDIAADQLARWIEARAKDGTVKRDEVEWSGLTDWLTTQKRVTRDQVQAFLADNGVKVDETTLGEPDYGEVEAWWNDEGGANEETPFGELTDEQKAQAVERYADEVGQYAEHGQTTKFASYQLPGGQNYRELLLTLPAEADQRNRKLAAIDAEYRAYAQPRVEKYGPIHEWPPEERAGIYAIERRHDAIADADRGQDFRSGHFDQPNVVAHVRFNERTDADGKKVLFIEEIQSDWAQKGRRDGFDGQRAAFEIRRGDEVLGIYSKRADAEDWLARAKAATSSARGLTIHETVSKKAGIPAAPFVQDTKAWTALSLKRMIRYAAEHGFDRVAWTTGEQQAARYSLANHFSTVEWKSTRKNDVEGRYVTLQPEAHRSAADVTFLVEHGKVADVSNRRLTGLEGKPLEDVVGKELAKRIIEQRSGLLDRQGLKIGGEGMRGFYDQIVPQVANDLLKKLGGGKVAAFNGITETGADSVRYTGPAGESAIADLATIRHDRGYTVSTANAAREVRKLVESGMSLIQAMERQGTIDLAQVLGGKLEFRHERGGPQPGFDITDVMREHAMRGLPMFEPRGWAAVEAAPDYIPPGVAADARTEADLETLRQSISRYLKTDLPAGTFRHVPLPDDAALQRIAGAFGKRVIGFDTDNPSAQFFAGVSKVAPDTIFLKRVVGRPHLAILGHELVHELRKDNPALYDRLAEALRPYIDEKKAFADFAANAAVWSRLPEDKLREEFIAEVVADGIVRPEFWKAVGKSNPSLLTTLRDALAMLVAKIKRVLGATYPRTRQYLADFDRALELAGKAMGEYAATRASEPRSLTEPSFLPADALPGWQALTRQKIEDEVAAALHSTKTFNLWHRTIGTQYHKAQIDRDFRPVFEATQRFLQDTSQFAMDASDQAPTLLPRLEHVRDVVKDALGRGVKKADVNKVAEQVFAATLAKTRPSKESLAAAGLNDKQVALAMEARHAIDRSLDDLAGSIAGQLVRKERMFNQSIVDEAKYAPPRARALYEAEVERLESAAGKALTEATKHQRQALKQFEDDAAAKLKAAKGPGGRLAVEQENDAARAELTAEWAKSLAAIEQQHAHFKALAKSVRDTFAKAAKLKAEGYAPLMRFGRFTVTVTDPTSGETLFFSMHEREADAKRMLRDVQADPAFEGAAIRAGVMSQKRFELFRGISPETLSLFADVIGAEGDEVFQQYLKTAIGTRSALKRYIHRKGIAGFDTDLQRVLAQFVTSNSRLASRNYHFGEMLDAAAAIPQEKGDVADEATALVKYVQNPTEEAQLLRGFLFVNFLGGSIASALVNMTQPLTMTLPWLAQFGGVGRATGHLVSGARIAAGAQATGKLREAMALAAREGITSPHEIHQLQAEAIRGFGSNIHVRRGLKVWGSLFSLAEQFNRRSTFVAAFELAEGMSQDERLKQGIFSSYDFARHAVEETQGIYNRGNRPTWARGAVGATLFTFKQFTISYVEFVKRLPPKERVLAMAIMLVAAGAEGLPFGQDLEDMIDAIGQSLGYATNSQKTLRRVAVETLGEPFGKLLTSGFSALPGVPLDVAGRLGMGNIIPGTQLLKHSEPDKTRGITDVLGPAGSFATSVGQAGAAAMGGDIAGAGKALLPNAVQNAIKGVDMWNTGQYKDSKGRRVVDVDKADAALKFIGLQPSKVAEDTRRTSAVQQDTTLLKTVEGEIAQKWAEGQAEHDPAKIAEARARLQEWNAQNGQENRIRIDSSQIQRRVNEMRKLRSDRVTKSAAPEQRARVREELR
jgi:hypothetical protein